MDQNTLDGSPPPPPVWYPPHQIREDDQLDYSTLTISPAASAHPESAMSSPALPPDLAAESSNDSPDINAGPPPRSEYRDDTQAPGPASQQNLSPASIPLPPSPPYPKDRAPADAQQPPLLPSPDRLPPSHHQSERRADRQAPLPQPPPAPRAAPTARRPSLAVLPPTPQMEASVSGGPSTGERGTPDDAPQNARPRDRRVQSGHTQHTRADNGSLRVNGGVANSPPGSAATRTFSHDGRYPSRAQSLRFSSAANPEINIGMPSQISERDSVIPPAAVATGGRNTARHDADTQRRQIETITSAADTATRDKRIKDRLEPTLEYAEMELARSKRKARTMGYALNICIAIQVVLGALTTGIAASSRGNSVGVTVAILGGLSTLAASYLARARGSGEPETSLLRSNDLEHYIRDLKAFLLDHGDFTGAQLDKEVDHYRRRFEAILGNASQNQRAATGPAPMPGLGMDTMSMMSPDPYTQVPQLPGTAYSQVSPSPEQAYAQVPGYFQAVQMPSRAQSMLRTPGRAYPAGPQLANQMYAQAPQASPDFMTQVPQLGNGLSQTPYAPQLPRDAIYQAAQVPLDAMGRIPQIERDVMSRMPQIERDVAHFVRDPVSQLAHAAGEVETQLEQLPRDAVQMGRELETHAAQFGRESEMQLAQMAREPEMQMGHTGRASRAHTSHVGREAAAQSSYGGRETRTGERAAYQV